MTFISVTMPQLAVEAKRIGFPCLRLVDRPKRSLSVTCGLCLRLGTLSAVARPGTSAASLATADRVGRGPRLRTGSPRPEWAGLGYSAVMRPRMIAADVFWMRVQRRSKRVRVAVVELDVIPRGVATLQPDGFADHERRGLGFSLADDLWRKGPGILMMQKFMREFVDKDGEGWCGSQVASQEDGPAARDALGAAKLVV